MADEAQDRQPVEVTAKRGRPIDDDEDDDPGDGGGDEDATWGTGGGKLGGS